MGRGRRYHDMPPSPLMGRGSLRTTKQDRTGEEEMTMLMHLRTFAKSGQAMERGGSHSTLFSCSLSPIWNRCVLRARVTMRCDLCAFYVCLSGHFAFFLFKSGISLSIPTYPFIFLLNPLFLYPRCGDTHR